MAQTCWECGRLLSAAMFSRGGGGRRHTDGRARRGWKRTCKDCFNAAQVRYRSYEPMDASVMRERQAALQMRSLPAASRSGLPWTEADWKVLSDTSLSVAEKASIVRRTHRAVQQQTYLHGWASRVGPPRAPVETWVLTLGEAGRNYLAAISALDGTS